MGNEASRAANARGSARPGAKGESAPTPGGPLSPASAAAASSGGERGAPLPRSAAAAAAAADAHSSAVTIPKVLQHPIGIEDFELLKVVGKGSFGKVFCVLKRTGPDAGSVYAMKTLRKDVLAKRGQLEHTRAERLILQAVNHPFIVSLKCAFQAPDKLYLVTDFCSGGELFFWLKRERVFAQARARLYAAELVLALSHLHSLDIVYRDLKPENILLDAEGHVKLTDFGLSKMHVRSAGPEEGTMTFCGTPEYLAPEILQNQGHGKAVDWWSLGTLLYEMMAGLPPYYDTNIETMYERILTAELRFPRSFLPETRSLLSGMLTRKVEDRLGYRGAEEIQAHPFFKDIDWAAVMARRIQPQFTPPANGPVASGGGSGGVGGAGAGAGAPAARCGGQGVVAGGEVIVSNFEDEFTGEAPVDSAGGEDGDSALLSSTAVAAAAVAFEGFTFVGESALGGSLGRDEGVAPVRAPRYSRAESYVEAHVEYD